MHYRLNILKLLSNKSFPLFKVPSGEDCCPRAQTTRFDLGLERGLERAQSCFTLFRPFFYFHTKKGDVEVDKA